MTINTFSVLNAIITVHYILEANIFNKSSKKYRTEIRSFRLQSLFYCVLQSTNAVLFGCSYIFFVPRFLFFYHINDAQIKFLTDFPVFLQ
jgi:hypothetical protein